MTVAGVKNDDANSMSLQSHNELKTIKILSKRLSKRFERYWNKYKTKSESKNTKNEYRYFLKSEFVVVYRLCVLIYLKRNNGVKRYYSPIGSNDIFGL